jgi:hypothetical protein
MTIQEKAIEFAVIEYNNNAGEEGSNNSGPFVRKYLNDLAEPPANWCAAFVCWCVQEASTALNVEMPFQYTLSARKIFNIFKTNGWLVEKMDNPIPGDLIFFWRGDPNSWMGHIGFVSDMYEEEDAVAYHKYIETLEGNKGYFPARVEKYSYFNNNIPKLLGFGRIK